MTNLFNLVRTKRGKKAIFMTDCFVKVKARKKALEASQRKMQVQYEIQPAEDGDLKYRRPPSLNFDPSGDAGGKKWRKRTAMAKKVKQKNPRGFVPRGEL